MNSPGQNAAPRRSFWRWLLFGVGLCLAPVLLLALVALSYITLDRDAAVLRRQVMAASPEGWGTKFQLDVGRTTLGAIRCGLGLVHDRNLADARLALAAVRHASVGVYARTAGKADWSRPQLFAAADRAMGQRGWTRLVGVADPRHTVLVYAARDLAPDEPVAICVAVVEKQKLVVVSTTVDAVLLAELAARHAPGEGNGPLQLAGLRL